MESLVTELDKIIRGIITSILVYNTVFGASSELNWGFLNTI